MSVVALGRVDQGDLVGMRGQPPSTLYGVELIRLHDVHGQALHEISAGRAGDGLGPEPLDDVTVHVAYESWLGGATECFRDAFVPEGHTVVGIHLDHRARGPQ
ncbi:hypothetical protein [Streptomyces ziwulingensis]|uniref:hypothetical protein n=1 Tax=Streptomyces ziwulingensis TaxID=1045501 RepID=UPI003CD08545